MCELLVIVLDPQRTARLAAMHRGQVARAAFGREPVKHGAHELHERCLTGLVRTVEHGHAARQVLEMEVRPDAKSVDL